MREAWARTIRAADYDAHMMAVGQAQVNAELVAELLRDRPPQADARVLFVGAGTGQMFDFISAEILRPFVTTFADINREYLEKLRERLAPFRGLRFETFLDDIEDSQLAPGFALAIAVLVLEHVDWRKAVACLCRLSSERVFIVLQENPPGAAHPMTRPPVGTMEVLGCIHTRLLAPADVDEEFCRNAFRLVWRCERAVPDEKKMLACEYRTPAKHET